MFFSKKGLIFWLHKIKNDKSQQLDEGDNLSNFGLKFKQELTAYRKEKDAYKKSIIKGKLERILMELQQKIEGDTSQTAAIKLLQKLQTAFDQHTSDYVKQVISADVQANITAIVGEIKTLLKNNTAETLASN